MRRHHQNQISGLLGQIKKIQVEEKYAECQEVALFLCDFIESVAGEGTEIVKEIEEYCELLFKAHNGENVKGLLKKRIVKIENLVKSELKPTRYEIAFLSYKAAQSDALESIYLAAKKDPNCDAFWIPIPYSPKNPDKSLGEQELEGLGYYDERFEITNYKEYDIEARRPDAIFTFNTYDKTSFMMQTPDEYFCETLRGQTDMLIYMPYFIFNDAPVDMGPEEIVKWFNEIHDRDFVKDNTRAASLHCHKAFLPSTNLANMFKGGFDTVIPKHKKYPGDTNEKFIALGSPKIEKVLGATKENYPLPKELADKVEGKKVILVNMSVSPVNSGGIFLKKLSDLVDYFLYAEKTVLWWRPHPLLEASMSVINPDALDILKRATNLIKTSDSMIYDDSVSYHQALAWADAFYGDLGTLMYSVPLLGIPAIQYSPSKRLPFGKELEEDAEISQALIDSFNSFELRAKLKYPVKEVPGLSLAQLAHFATSKENSPEIIAKRKELYVQRYGKPSENAGQRIYDYTKNEILKTFGS